MGVLLGLGVVVACLIVGGILLGAGHLIIGIAVLMTGVPGAIVAWMKWNDRQYGD